MRLSGLAPIFALVVLAASPAGAQSLAGRVADPQGAVVVGADVRLSGPALAAPRTTRSAADGTFSFDSVAPGRYSLRAEFAGFSVFSRDVTMLAGGLDVPITLQLAGFTEDLRVQGEVLDSSLTRRTCRCKDQPMNVNVICVGVPADVRASTTWSSAGRTSRMSAPTSSTASTSTRHVPRLQRSGRRWWTASGGKATGCVPAVERRAHRGAEGAVGGAQRQRSDRQLDQRRAQEADRAAAL